MADPTMDQIPPPQPQPEMETETETPAQGSLQATMEQFATMVSGFTSALISFMPGLNNAAATNSHAAQQQGHLPQKSINSNR